MLKVHVVDTGKGIEKAKLSKLHKLLTRDGSEDEEGIKMGLGLCSKIVEAFGGSIDVYSEGPSQGSTFSFSMKMMMVKTRAGGP